MGKMQLGKLFCTWTDLVILLANVSSDELSCLEVPVGLVHVGLWPKYHLLQYVSNTGYKNSISAFIRCLTICQIAVFLYR